MGKLGLKVLMFSTDRNLFEEGSAVSERIKEYGRLVEELHIIVLCDKSHTKDLKIENGKLKIAEGVFLYPTNSSFKFMRPRNAASIGKKLVREKGFVRGQSLITTQDPFECGWAGLRVKKKWRLPLEVQLHTDPFSSEFSGHLNSVRKRLAKKVLPQADHIRVVSASLKSTLIHDSRFMIPDSKISVLPIFVDKNREKDMPTFDLHTRFGWKFILLTVSRLTEEKNLPLALQVLALLRQRYSSVGLVIVGAGPEEESLKKLAKTLNIERNVAFEGWQEDLASYYKTANAYIQTSRFEGYGMSLVEAGLSGLPVVTTPVGVANDMENGKELYICPQDDAGYFANAIADLIDNNSHRENLRINMKNFLNSHLLSKEDYLNQLKKNWQETASKVLN